MTRRVIITVGKTHSGKSTFAAELERHLPHSAVIDQDNHAEFINTYYRALRPAQGPNTIKYAITHTIVDYAVRHTDRHLILCNSNRSRDGRTKLLDYFRQYGFESIIVFFDLPEQVLRERVAGSQRTEAIFRTAASFNEVLDRQIAASQDGQAADPAAGEADYLFVVTDSNQVQSVLHAIAALCR